ncbi:hypothetical protein WMY93_006393 [Mugilogobius chulae]|uniref:Immunoglobulin subtype domain-containing protein n=1 Tax=Mugilogobius chulae TaxID=88201 RepID=A0AAW0PR52_9GOBI
MGHVTKGDRFGCFVFLTWTIFLLSSTSGHELGLSLRKRVFVALKGENLSITYQLNKPPNLAEDTLTCFDPHNKSIYRFVISATAENETSDKIVLENMTVSGKYFCQYKNVKAFWFLRIRDHGYKEAWNFTEIIVVSVITCLLLVFSVGGTVYVFRGNWKCCTIQNKERLESQKEDGGTANAEPVQSTSFYASLKARPRSVYDVLDHPTTASVDGKRDKIKAKTTNKNELQNTVHGILQKQAEETSTVSMRTFES